MQCFDEATIALLHKHLPLQRHACGTIKLFSLRKILKSKPNRHVGFGSMRFQPFADEFKDDNDDGVAAAADALPGACAACMEA